MDVIAVRGGTNFILLTQGKVGDPEARGRAFDRSSASIGDEQLVASILKSGYWRPPNTRLDKAAVIRDAEAAIAAGH
jgi:hypothetical protein